MIEAPEALFLADQLNEVIKGKVITDVISHYTPHKFTFYYGEPEDFIYRLSGKRIDHAISQGGMVEIRAEEARLVFTDGVNLRYLAPGKKLPNKYQLLVAFEDESCLIASVRMYGGIFTILNDEFNAPIAAYYHTAVEKPQVMLDAFALPYFRSMIDAEERQKKSIKACLATEQTIPGVGNGVLQDILYYAGLHPKKKVKEIPPEERNNLYRTLHNTLRDIYQSKGRDTETDLFGNPGNYHVQLSSKSAGKACIRCGDTIRKENYLGGSIYYCPECQPL
ncbi:MAG: endonuclease VIII [Bacteroides sp.]|nr:endonuclease VIII [Bacteroides sp.]